MSEEDKLRILAKSKVYIHLMMHEHFGLAPLEALAMGCILIVPKSSGIWTDVCAYHNYNYCLGYDKLDISTLAKLVEYAIKQWNEGIVSQAVRIAKNFDIPIFGRKLLLLIHNVLEYKE